MKLLKNITRRIALLLRGVNLFKDWPLWLVYRFNIGFLKRGGETKFRLRNGIVFKIDLSRSNPGVFQEIWLMDLYEKFYKIKSNDIVVDIGAHIGVFSVLAASKGAKVYAYEPTPRSFRFLRENVKGYNVEPFNLAVSEKIGEIEIFEYVGGDEGNSSVPEHNLVGNKHFSARSTTLEEIFIKTRLKGAAIIKIDCEGCETSILRHAPKEIFAKIDNIAMEYHKNLSGVVDILKRNEFQILGTSGKEYGYLWAKHK